MASVKLVAISAWPCGVIGQATCVVVLGSGSICAASIWLKASNIMQRCWALPVGILLEQDGADEAQDAGIVREYAHHIGTAFHLLVQVLQRVGTVKPGSVPGREGHVG